jgi:hypothetical protein
MLPDDKKMAMIANNAFNKVQEFSWKKRAEKIIDFIY